MALFKILQGLDTKLNSSTNPVGLTEGYCYFTIDNNMFYVDHKNQNGTLVRSPLNAQNANTITEPAYNSPASVVHALDSDYNHIPSCWAIYSFLDEQLLPAFSDALDLKMDKENPTGTGYFSLNSSSATVGDYSFTAGFSSAATGPYSVAIGNSASASESVSIALGEGVSAKSANQTVLGKYNVEDYNNSYSLIVGNGTSASARSNMFTMDWSGNAAFAGTVTVASPENLNHAANKGYVDQMLETVVQLVVIKEV